MNCVLGVDGGASKTFSLVATEEGRILGFGRGGPSNHQVCGLEAAISEIRHAVQEAISQAQLSAPRVGMGIFCLAGADMPEDYAMLDQALERMEVCDRVVVKNDTMAALRSGLSRPWGVVVICGTGTNAAGRAPDGREIVFPGLDWMSGDWGGGGEISQQIIRRVMRAWDGRGQPTVLSQMVLQALGVSSPELLMRKLYHSQLDQHELLGLVPLVFEAAYAGDDVACQLVREVGTEIGITARTIIRRLSLQDKDVEVVLAGGIFKAKGPLLIDTVKRIIHEVAPLASVVLPKFEPVVGALFLALEAAGIDVEGTVQENVESTLPPGLMMEAR